MVAVIEDDILGSGDLSREWDEMKEKCEALEWENSELDKEFIELWVKSDLSNSLQGEVDRYGSLSLMASRIMSFKASLSEGEKCWKKASEYADEACCAFEVDQIVLRQKKDDQINILKSFEEEVVVARKKS